MELQRRIRGNPIGRGPTAASPAFRHSAKKLGAWHNRENRLTNNFEINKELEKYGGLNFIQGLLKPEQVVENGELAVSLLQKATGEINKIEKCLLQMEKRISDQFSKNKKLDQPDPELEYYIQTQLSSLRSFANETTFKGREILNGKLGIIGRGANTRVIGGVLNQKGVISARIEVELLKAATHSTMIGHQILTDEFLQKETEIVLSENKKTIKYRIASGETVESFIQGLKQSTFEMGLDIDIGLTSEGYLKISHNQCGSLFVFSGSSLNTMILSNRPSVLRFCHLGENGIGQVNGKRVQSRGNVLFCEQHIQGIDNLTILWEGDILGKDNLIVMDYSVPVPLGDYEGSATTKLAIKSCHPKDLAYGVKNQSDFKALSDINTQTWQSAHDALYLIRVGLVELGEYLEELELEKDKFQKSVMDALSKADLGLEEVNSKEKIYQNISSMAQMIQEAFAA